MGNILTNDSRNQALHGTLVDENFKKEVDYKPYAGCVHAELGIGKHLTANSRDYLRPVLFNFKFGQKLWGKQVIFEAR